VGVVVRWVKLQGGLAAKWVGLQGGCCCEVVPGKYIICIDVLDLNVKIYYKNLHNRAFNVYIYSLESQN